MNYPIGTILKIGDIDTVVRWVGYGGNVAISQGETEWYITVTKSFQDSFTQTEHDDLINILEKVKGGAA